MIEGGDTEEEYSRKKIKTLTDLLDLKCIFSELNPNFVSTVITEKRQNDSISDIKTISSRPLLDKLEDVAKALHENYRNKYPNTPHGKLTWEECSYHFRYDNISQARHLYDFVTNNGYIVCDKDEKQGLEEVFEINPQVVEKFVEKEHKRWYKNKEADGWRYGDKRDDDKKRHPLMIPYENLSENEKDKSRASLIEFAKILRDIGDALCKR